MHGDWPSVGLKAGRVEREKGGERVVGTLPLPPSEMHLEIESRRRKLNNGSLIISADESVGLMLEAFRASRSSPAQSSSEPVAVVGAIHRCQNAQCFAHTAFIERPAPY